MQVRVSVMKNLLGAAIAAFFFAVCSPTLASAQSTGVSQPIKGRYIVQFKESVGRPGLTADELVRGARGQLHFTYTTAFKGFAATLSDAAVAALRRNPNVLSIEQDSTVYIEATQTPATWGLDRIDQRSLPLSNTFSYNEAIPGIYAFIVDTGILANHSEFTGRVQVGLAYDAITSGGSASDCNGHGTHVAATVGGATYGVAKKVLLVPVKVLDCAGSGSISGVIAGIDYVVKSGLRPALANMSLGGGASSALDAAVANAVSQGVTVVVAAGNSNRDACNHSPARVASAITVGATDSSDSRASYSNFGKCLDLFAPGSSITSAWYTATNAIATLSGTSMASPHVAGVAALVIGSGIASPSAVVAEIKKNATSNKVGSAGRGSPNLLLYSPPPAP
ncbi:MAG: S8 family peptidase [Actinobacteria bacterium]|nr:S8 family peptidase [Actinomycetota bacterium]